MLGRRLEGGGEGGGIGWAQAQTISSGGGKLTLN